MENQNHNGAFTNVSTFQTTREFRPNRIFFVSTTPFFESEGMGLSTELTTDQSPQPRVGQNASCLLHAARRYRADVSPYHG